MALLTLNRSLPNMSKATISVWFRIPTAAFDAAISAKSYWGFEVFNGVIPILVLGKQKSGPTASAEQTVIGHYTDTVTHESVPVLGPINRVRTAPMSPTVIGVYKDSDSSKPPTLFLHLQTQDKSTHTNTNQDITGFKPILNDVGEPIGVEKYIGVDASYADDELEFFNKYGDIDVSLDQWHHLLISWDLKNSNKSHGTKVPDASADLVTYVTASSKLFCALDDKNLTEFDLPLWWVQGGGSNDIITNNCFDIAGRTQLGVSGDPSVFTVNFVQGIIVDAMYIPADSISYQRDRGPPWGVPSGAGSETGNVIQKVEMAELQIFSGVSLDTGTVSNRRAFIDYVRDTDGNIVIDGSGKSEMEPVDPENGKAKTVMGKRPVILLHGTNNWQEGANTGSLGMTDVDQKILVGQFRPTGTISKYEPDPSLRK